MPGSDLNASLTGVVLPQSGRWLVIAGTTKGSGGYSLTFELTPAATPSSAQLRPVDDTHSTLTTGGTVKPIAFFFDPEGRPMSGARVQWLKTPEAGDAANISFPSDGLAPRLAGVSSVFRGMRTIRFGPFHGRWSAGYRHAGDGHADASLLVTADLAGQARLTGSCVQAAGTATVTLTLEGRHYETTGLAPGALVPGTTVSVRRTPSFPASA